MSTSIVPIKTELGRQELSQRGKRISQRHRTVLLLVDGKRPLSLVLSLAQQAGASTQYFEELLGLGLVELPDLPAEPPKVQPAPVEAHAAELTAAEPAMVADIPLVVEAGPVEEPAMPATAAVPVAQTAAPDAEPAPARPVTPEPHQKPAIEIRHVRRPRPRKPIAEAALLPSAEIELGEPRPVETPAEEAPDLPMVAQVRQLLQKVVEIAPPPVRFRVPSRLARARTAAELGEMVDVIEHCMRRARYSLVAGEGADCLVEAREILGLGNTRIHEGGE